MTEQKIVRHNPDGSRTAMTLRPAGPMHFSGGVAVDDGARIVHVLSGWPVCWVRDDTLTSPSMSPNCSPPTPNASGTFATTRCACGRRRPRSSSLRGVWTWPPGAWGAARPPCSTSSWPATTTSSTTSAPRPGFATCPGPSAASPNTPARATPWNSNPAPRSSSATFLPP